MKKIEISNIGKYIDAAPIEMPLMFIGDTGIGKTQSITEYAKNNGYFLKTLVLSQLRPDEALGIPTVKDVEFGGKIHSVLKTAIPEWVLELAQEEKAILFLDEILTAKPDVQNAFLNFITERKVDGIDLSHVKIISATNIGIYSYTPDINILSRFCMFYAVNTQYNSFINDSRLQNTYKDETDFDHVVFDERSLKPRCQYLLSLMKEDSLFQDFYEGFTNSPIFPVFSSNKRMNDILIDLYKKQEGNEGVLNIDIPNLGLLITHISNNFPRVKDFKAITKNFTKNVTLPKTISGEDINEFVSKRLNV